MTSNIKNNQTRDLNPESVRKKIVILLIGTEILISSLSVLYPTDLKLIGDTSGLASTGAAFLLCWIVVARQKIDGVFGRAYLSLAIGLTFWVVGVMIWTYYDIGLTIEPPFPSLADIFWIVGYIPVMYFIFKICKIFGNSKLANIILVTISAIIFVSFYIYNIISSSNLSSFDNLVLFLVSIAYPIADVLFIIPASLIILNSGKGKLTSVPWIFLGMLTFAVADSIFGYATVLGFTFDFVWDPLYFVGSFLIAVGIFWHNKYFIFDEKKLARSWEEDNR